MIDSRASRAPTSPPETGASMLCTPCARAAARDLDGQRRLAGGHVDQDVARLAAGQGPLGPQHHGSHIGRKADDRKDTSAACGHGLGRVGPNGSSGQQRLGPAPGAIVNRNGKAGGQQVAAHAGAHHAGADPTELRFIGPNFRQGHTANFQEQGRRRFRSRIVRRAGGSE